MQPWSAKFYASKQWHKARKGYIAHRVNIDGGRCEECNFSQGYIVHHIIPITEANIGDAEVSLSWSNFRYVCKDCHDLYDGHGLAHNNTPAVVVFDENGDPLTRVIPPV